jgi:hypothetical protein
MSISLFGPVGCGRPFRDQRDIFASTTLAHHNGFKGDSKKISLINYVLKSHTILLLGLFLLYTICEQIFCWFVFIIPYQLRFGANWGQFRANGSLFEENGSKSHTKVNTLQHVLLVCSRFAPHRDGMSSGMYANAMKPLKMDPIVVIVHSTFLFCNGDLC